MPPIPIIIGITVNKNNLAVSGVTVTLTHSSGVMTETTDSTGKVIFNTGNLDSFTSGDSVTFLAVKSGIGRISDTRTISGNDQFTLTLAETSDLVRFDDNTKQHVLNFALLVGFDGEKITSSNPIPVSSQDPLVKYHPADEDVGEGLEYHGFVDKDGNWYIDQYNLTNGTFRYARGSSGYPDNWSDRTNLTYDYFYNVF